MEHSFENSPSPRVNIKRDEHLINIRQQIGANVNKFTKLDEKKMSETYEIQELKNAG